MAIELHIKPEAEAILSANGFDGFEAFFKTDAGEDLDKPGLVPWRRRRRIVSRDAADRTHVYYLKCYDHPPAASIWSRLSGSGEDALGPAQREVRQIEALASAGIPALQWAAWGRDAAGGRERRSFVLAEAVPGDALERWLPGPFAEMAPERQKALKAVVSERLAALVRKLHGAGFVHRDLYLSHVFIDVEDDANVHLHVIDVQRVFRPRWLRQRWIVKDLAALNYSTPRAFASRADRLRWLKLYLDIRRLGPAEKRLALRIVRKCAKMARHDRRRARQHTA
jgi:hypothetical protein